LKWAFIFVGYLIYLFKISSLEIVRKCNVHLFIYETRNFWLFLFLLREISRYRPLDLTGSVHLFNLNLFVLVNTDYRTSIQF
jgi:hypothetical protein